MNSRDPDRLLKRLWLVIGFLTLPLFVLGLFEIGSEFMRDLRGGDEFVVAAPTNEPVADGLNRAVRFDVPEAIRGVDAQLIVVRHGTAYEAPAMLSGGAASLERAQFTSLRYFSSAPIVNVMVVPTAGAGRLVFDRPAFIHFVGFPGDGDSRSDSLQTWISYEVALDDTNEDGQLDTGDAITLYVSDLHGLNVRRVLPEGWSLRSQRTLSDRRTILMTALQRPTESSREWKPEEAPQRAFLYDVATNARRPFASVDSLASRAGAILAAPRRDR